MVHSRKLVLTVAAAFALMLAMGGALFAAAPAGAAASDSHPAHIHTGACPAPDAVVFPLSDVSAKSLVNGTPTAGTTSVGQANPLTVEASSTIVKATLADLADGKHSIVIHQSVADIVTYLVCGNIGGVEMGPGGLSIGLSPVKDSGYIGIATLIDNRDGTTTVNLFLMVNPVTAAPTGGSTSGSTSNSGSANGGSSSGGSSNGASGNSANGGNSSMGNGSDGNSSMGNESDANSGMGNGSDSNSSMGNESDGNASAGNESDGNMSMGNESDSNASMGNGSDGNPSSGNGSADGNASGNGS